MYFPISGVEVSPLVPVLVGAGVSFLGSMAGISGAFLLLPFQMSVLGYTSPSVSGTNHLYNVVAIPSGVYRYVREQRMVWPLTMVIAIGTLPGVFAGTWIRVQFLPDARDFKLFVGAVLLYIGFRLFIDVFRKRAARAISKSDFAVVLECFSIRELRYSFQGQSYACKPVVLFVLSLVVGLIGGAYGIGGGAIMAPFLVAWFGLPVHTIAGATLMSTFLASTMGVAFFMFLGWQMPAHAVTPDWFLGVLFGLGGLIGMYFGAKCQKYFPARIIKAMLVCIICSAGFKYSIDYFFA